jgi:glycerophosphoryl diester phosphodiesterase
MKRTRAGVLALAGLALLSVTGIAIGSANAAGTGSAGAAAHGRSHDDPVIVGHRGAPGYRPEHTLASYELAYRMGVDFVDVDLVPTKDGRLVARHEPEIGGTTDVAQHPEFASRKKTLVIDGVATTGWFTQDFTLAELKTLRAVERIPQNRPHNTLYNGRYRIATFQEVLDLTQRLGRELHRTLGTYPEVKHSTFFRSIGNPTEPKLVAALERNGLDRPDAPAIIQSFEVSNLIALHREVRTPLLQLTSATGAPADFVAQGDKRTYADIVSASGLRDVAKYAKYLGPDKGQLIPLDAAGKLTAPTAIVADAHRAGLEVQPYTFRNENPFLPANLRSSAEPDAYGDVFTEEAAFLKAGVDGFFADQPDTALESLHAFLGR